VKRSITSAFSFGLFVLCFALVAGFSAGAYLPKDPPATQAPSFASVGTAPQCVVMSSDRESLNFKIQFSNFSSEIVTGDEKKYSRIRIPSCPVTDETGYPELPYIKKFVAIPECKDISVAFSAKDHQANDIDVYPVPRIVYEPNPEGCGPQPREQFEKNAKAYAQDALYPEATVKVAKVFTIRGQRVAELHIYPLHYNPKKRVLHVTESLDITLTYKEATFSVCMPTGPFESLCKSLLLNYEYGSASAQAPGRFAVNSGTAGHVDTITSLTQCPGADYVMIVGHQLWTSGVAKNAVLSLAQKRADFNGFTVAVIDVADIVGFPASVDADVTLKEHLIEFYQDYSNADHMGDGKLGYIMLIGDAYICPADNDSCPPELRETIVPAHHETYIAGYPCYPPIATAASDNWYASLDALDDFSPDVFIGRASVDDPGEAQRFLQKIAEYEPQNVSNNWHNWRRKVALVQGNWSILTDETDLCRNLTPPGYELNELYRGIKNKFEYSQEIRDSIDAGYLLLLEYGHGMEYYWQESFYPKYYDALSNENHYPVIFAFSCLTAKFDLPCHMVLNAPGCAPCGHPNRSNCDYPKLQTICDPLEGLETDAYDCMAERMTEAGNSGAVAYVGFSGNAMSSDFSALPYFYDKFFSSGSIGETVLATFYQLSWRNQIMLTLISDPALNVLFEDYTPPSDSTDIAIDWRDVEFDEPVLNTCGSNTCTAKVRNLGVHDAHNVPIVLYMDSVPVDDMTIGLLEAYHDTTVNFVITSAGEGSHSLSVRANPESAIVEMNYENNAVDTMMAAFCLQPGFPVDLESIGAVAPPAVLFANGDGYKEILVNQNGTDIHSIDQSGTVLATKSNLNMQPSYVMPVGLVNSALQRSILCVQHAQIVSTQRHLTLLDSSNLQEVPLLMGTGDFLADKSTSSFAGAAALYDVDHDGYNDVLYYERYYEYASHSESDFTGTLRIFRYDPDSLLFDPAASLSLDYRPVDVAIEDLDYDNNPEIAILGFVGWIGQNPLAMQIVIDVYTLDASMSLTLKKHVTFDYPSGIYPVYTGGDPFKGCIQICDLDYSPLEGNNYLDVVAALNNKLLVIRTTATSLDTFSITGPLEYYPGTELEITQRCGLSCVDLDMDGQTEMVLSSDHRMSTYRFENGAISLVDSTTISSDYSIVAGPLVSDVDGDDGLEVLVATVDATDNWRHPSHIDLHLLNAALDEEREWVNIPGDEYIGLVVDDIDADAKQEIILQTRSQLHAFEMQSSSGSDPLWAMDDGNIARTNCTKKYLKGIYDENVSLFGPTRLLGDISIAYMKHLFVRPGADVEVGLMDETEGGSDVQRVELNVSGTLRAEGTDIEPIPFKSMTSGSMNWVGIDMTGCGAVGYLKHCDVSNAIRGYYCSGASIPDTIQHSSFTSCGTAGIYIAGAGGYNATYVSNCAASGNGGSGIVIDHCDDAVIDSCICNNNTSNGVSLLYSCSTIKNSTMQGNSYGIRSDATSGDAPLISHCTASQNSQAGAYFKNTAGKIEYSSLSNNSLYGLLCEGTYTTVEVKSNLIASNNIGVKTTSSSYPVLGNVPTQKGMLNSIYGNTNQNVYHGSSGVLKAERCWWGAVPPPKKFYGNIDYIPYLGDDPIPQQESSPKPTDIADVTYSLSDNYPNPFNPMTTIEYSIAEDSHVNLSIYNVNGQVVRTLVSAFQNRSAYRVVWDGKNDNGVSVSSGVYFSRLQASSFVKTKKLVLLR
jgi:hypothetical protein